MGYYYDVIRGDSEVFDPRREANCRYSKVLVPDRDHFEPMARRAFQEHQTDPTFSTNVVVILCVTIAGNRTCSYHYGRALATALVEAVGGTSGPEYDEFLPAFASITVELAGHSKASPEWVANAYRWIDEFTKAAAAGGLREFMRLYKASEDAP